MSTTTMSTDIYSPDSLPLADQPLIDRPLWTERLRSGIWPKSPLFWLVALYMACFIIRPWERLFPFLSDFRFERIMVILVAGTVLLMRGPFVKITLQNVAMVLMYGAVWLSSLFAYNPVTSEIQTTEFFGFLLSFFIIQKIVKTPYQLFFVVGCYFMATAAFMMKSEWEYIFNGAAWEMMGVWRLRGVNDTFGHPNNVGISLVCSLPITVFFWREKDAFCRTWPPMLRKAFGWFVPVYFAAAILGIVLTRSRASAIGMILFLALLVIRKGSMAARIKWGIIFALLCVTGFFLAPEDIRYRIQSTWDPSVEYKAGMGGANESAEGRLEGLMAGIEIFRRFPVTGVGIGNFADYRSIHVDQVKLDAHNLPGEVMAELGTVGCVAFVVFFTAMCINCVRLSRMGKEFAELTGHTIYRHLGVGLTDAVVLLVYGGVSCHTLQYYQWYWFGTFLATSVLFLKPELAHAREQLALVEAGYGDEWDDEAEELVYAGGGRVVEHD